MNFHRFQLPFSRMTVTSNQFYQNQNSKIHLGVEQSSRTTPDPEIVVLDSCAILWTIHWSSPGQFRVQLKKSESWTIPLDNSSALTES